MIESLFFITCLLLLVSFFSHQSKMMSGKRRKRPLSMHVTGVKKYPLIMIPPVARSIWTVALSTVWFLLVSCPFFEGSMEGSVSSPLQFGVSAFRQAAFGATPVKMTLMTFEGLSRRYEWDREDNPCLFNYTKRRALKCLMTETKHFTAPLKYNFSR